MDQISMKTIHGVVHRSQHTMRMVATFLQHIERGRLQIRAMRTLTYQHRSPVLGSSLATDVENQNNNVHGMTIAWPITMRWHLGDVLTHWAVSGWNLDNK